MKVKDILNTIYIHGFSFEDYRINFTEELNYSLLDIEYKINKYYGFVLQFIQLGDNIKFQITPIKTNRDINMCETFIESLFSFAAKHTKYLSEDEDFLVLFKDKINSIKEFNKLENQIICD